MLKNSKLLGIVKILICLSFMTSLLGCNEIFNTNKEVIEVEDDMTTVNDDIYVFKSKSGHNSMVLITNDEKEAALVDISLDRKVVESVKNYIDDNGLILKHCFKMHTSDLAVYQKKEFQSKETQFYIPGSFKDKVEDEQIIQMGDKKIQVFIPEDQIADKFAFVTVNDSVLIGGDLINTNQEPIAKSCMSLKNVILSLEKIKEKDVSIIIPGRGEATTDLAIIDNILDKVKEDYNQHEFSVNDAWTTIGDDIVVSSGNYHRVNMTLVVSGKEATLIDTGYSKQEALAIQTYLEKNNITLKTIIYTHSHSDHVGNQKMFVSEGVEVYKFEDTEDGQIIQMGDKELKIIHTPGHFNDKHLSVSINDDILVAGDVVLTAVSPSVGLSSTDNIEHLIETLNKLNQNEYSVIIPGHGYIALNNTVFKEQLNFWEYYLGNYHN